MAYGFNSDKSKRSMILPKSVKWTGTMDELVDFLVSDEFTKNDNMCIRVVDKKNQVSVGYTRKTYIFRRDYCFADDHSSAGGSNQINKEACFSCEYAEVSGSSGERINVFKTIIEAYYSDRSNQSETRITRNLYCRGISEAFVGTEYATSIYDRYSWLTANTTDIYIDTYEE